MTPQLKNKLAEIAAAKEGLETLETQKQQILEAIAAEQGVFVGATFKHNEFGRCEVAKFACTSTGRNIKVMCKRPDNHNWLWEFSLCEASLLIQN